VLIFVTYYLSGIYGICLAAIGMLSNLTISFTIHSYGTITDNAGGISNIALHASNVKEITDELDAAGNATSSLGKSFANGAACIVSISLIGAFITRTNVIYFNLDYKCKYVRSYYCNYIVIRCRYSILILVSDYESCFKFNKKNSNII
jgi:Na+/H+-translocating membrane pyrophosphatase